MIGEGGRIEWQVDTWRVSPAGLQVTRSIGDDDLKPAVTAEPEISETILSADDEFLVTKFYVMIFWVDYLSVGKNNR